MVTLISLIHYCDFFILNLVYNSTIIIYKYTKTMVKDLKFHPSLLLKYIKGMVFLKNFKNSNNNNYKYILNYYSNKNSKVLSYFMTKWSTHIILSCVG